MNYVPMGWDSAHGVWFPPDSFPPFLVDENMMEWTVETLNSTVDQELQAQPADIRARLVWISRLIEEHGIPNIREPYVKHIEGELWEIRMKGRDRVSRSLYITVHSGRVVILRVFVKKTPKTPRSEIRTALKRAKEIKP